MTYGMLLQTAMRLHKAKLKTPQLCKVYFCHYNAIVSACVLLNGGQILYLGVLEWWCDDDFTLVSVHMYVCAFISGNYI